MPSYIVTAPTGQKFKVTAPEGATQEQVLAYAQSQFDAPSQAERPQAPQATAMNRADALASGFNRGVVGLAGLPMDTVANLVDLAKAGIGYGYGKVTGKPVPSALEITPREQIPLSGDWLANQLDAGTQAIGAGPVTKIPAPNDLASRYLYAAGQGSTAALTGPSAGAKVIPSLISGVVGAESGQVAAESGASQGVQAIVANAGAMAPGAARYGIASGTKAAIRGGEQGRVKTANNIAAFEQSGAKPSVGQATQSRAMQATEALLTRTPGGSGVMTGRATTQAQNLGTHIEALADELSPKASAQQAGAAITKGITGEGGFVEQFKTRQSNLYDQMDNHIASDRPVDISKTKTALDELTAEIQGAPQTSKFFQNAKIKAIKAALEADTAPPQQEAGQPKFYTSDTGKLPFQALKKLRTLVGNELADAGPFSDVPRSKWKALYSALSKDLEGAAQEAGPKAQAAFERANNYTRAGMKRLDVIDSVIDRNGGPEAVFKAATSGTREGATVLRAVMQSLPKDAQKIVSATALRRMGRAKAGIQDDSGETFSTETFLTNWSAMSPEAKGVLFDRHGSGFRQDMDTLARVSANLRQGSAVFRNPSGSGQAIAQASAATAFLGALFTGHPFGAAGIASGVGGANLVARLMTNPKAVHWLATTTKAPTSAVPGLIAQLTKSNDADLKEFGEALQHQ